MKTSIFGFMLVFGLTVTMLYITVLVDDIRIDDLTKRIRCLERDMVYLEKGLCGKD